MKTLQRDGCPHIVHASGLCPAAGLCGACRHDLPNPEEVDACRAWLREYAAPRKTINRRRSSYGLKHAVEHASRKAGLSHHIVDGQGRTWECERIYVSNGAFIAAALLEGYQLKPTGSGSPNAHFNIAFPKGTPEATP